MADKGSKLKKPARRQSRPAENTPLAVVGIGVCAASFKALGTLFDILDDDLPATYVVAVRQQDGLTVDRAVEELSRQISIPVATAKNGVISSPGRSMSGAAAS